MVTLDTENQVSMSGQVNQTRKIYLNIPSLLPTLNSVQVNMDLVHLVIKNLLKNVTGQFSSSRKSKFLSSKLGKTYSRSKHSQNSSRVENPTLGTTVSKGISKTNKLLRRRSGVHK